MIQKSSIMSAAYSIDCPAYKFKGYSVCREFSRIKLINRPYDKVSLTQSQWKLIMALEKMNFQALSALTERKFVLFGSGNIAGKSVRNLPNGSVAFIVDNSVSLQGLNFKGLAVKNPSILNKTDHIVLICSTDVSAISTQLNSLDFIENQDYFVSPIINDLLAIEELENIHSEFYFTSGSAVSNDSQYGGGLYKCIVSRNEVSLHKVYSGHCYGATKVNGYIYFVDTDAGVFSLSSEDHITKCIELPKGARAHGISYNSDNKNFYLTCSYLDAVLEYSSNFEFLRTFRLSEKIDKTNEPMHHCNDNYSVSNSLYVSMFSSTGNWKLDKFDGCVAEFDISSGKRLPDVESGLYMPHNIQIINGSMHILDSLPGHLRYGNLQIQASFPAFTRGLDFYGGYYYVGQSKNRNHSRVIGLSNNVSVDCGVIIWDPNLKVSRFLQFSNAIGEIHSIVVSS